jgi:hypothetical protein
MFSVYTPPPPSSTLKSLNSAHRLVRFPIQVPEYFPKHVKRMVILVNTNCTCSKLATLFLNMYKMKCLPYWCTCSIYGIKFYVKSKEKLTLEASCTEIKRRVIKWNFLGLVAASHSWTLSKPMFWEPSLFPWWWEQARSSKRLFIHRSTTRRSY